MPASHGPIHHEPFCDDRLMDESQQTLGTADGALTRSGREPAMLCYSHILWNHRLLIVLGSLLPALLLALAVHLIPAQYTTTLVYERPLTESEYSMLLGRFYSSENLAKILTHLREKGISDYASKLERAETHVSLEKLIRFKVSPPHPQRPNSADPATWERINLLEAQLLDIEVTGGSKDDIPGICAVVTANFENVLPVYDIRSDLKTSAQEFETLAAEIEENRFPLTADLKKEEMRLERLLGLADTPLESTQGNVVLQFTEVAESREFLPLSYQIRAAQSTIIDLEETLRSERDAHSYCVKVLELNDRLLRKIEESLLTDCTVQQLLDFLDEQLAACTEETLADYVQSYIRRTQNLILANTRVGEKPIVCPVSKRVLARSLLALVVLLMVTSFLAVAIEYNNERRKLPRPQTGSPGPSA